MRRAYTFLCKTVPPILGQRNATFLHRGALENRHTFEGRLSCGACCYMLHHYLEMLGIHTIMMHKALGKEDHCFLMHNATVIDPTHRQFLPVAKWKGPFIFVGTVNDIEALCERQFWSHATESEEVMDATSVLMSRTYAKTKGRLFLDVHEKMNNNLL